MREIDAVFGELDRVHANAATIAFAAEHELVGVDLRDARDIVRRLFRHGLRRLPTPVVEEDLSVHLLNGKGLRQVAVG